MSHQQSGYSVGRFGPGLVGTRTPFSTERCTALSFQAGAERHSECMADGVDEASSGRSTIFRVPMMRPMAF